MEYLISETRVYSPKTHEWITLDGMLKNSPREMLNGHLSEGDGTSYANNNPLSFLDPSGYIAVPTAFALGGLTMGIGSVLGQRIVDGDYRNAGSSFISGFISGVSAIAFGGVGGAIVSAGGTVGLTTSLSINPITSFFGALAGMGVSSMLSLGEAVGSETISRNSIFNFDMNNNFSRFGHERFDFNGPNVRNDFFDRDYEFFWRGEESQNNNYSLGDWNFD